MHDIKKLWLDGPVEIARYDRVQHPFLEKLTKQQLSYFWLPQRIDVSKDPKDFKGLTPAEQDIITLNLSRQTILDTKQGADPATILGPLASCPELQTWIMTWTFFETIHSRSYTHIIQTVYPRAAEVFDNIMNIPEIVECSESISKYYNDLERVSAPYRSGEKLSKSQLYDIKKSLWLCLNSINALEGIRFYVSFACTWAFAELKKMEGNAKIIKEIARDENLHLASTQQLLKAMIKDDPDFAKIEVECAPEVLQIFLDVIDQEKRWATFIMKNGSMIGLNAEVLHTYIDWIGAKRMKAIGVEVPWKVASANPLPWTTKWIAGSDVQVAPQETEVQSYVDGSISKTVTKDSFADFKL